MKSFITSGPEGSVPKKPRQLRHLSSLYADFVCLFDLILYVPVNNFSVMSGWLFLG